MKYKFENGVTSVTIGNKEYAFVNAPDLKDGDKLEKLAKDKKEKEFVDLFMKNKKSKQTVIIDKKTRKIIEECASYSNAFEIDTVSLANQDRGAHNVDDPQVLDALNVFVGNIARRTFAKPNTPINELEFRLQQAGITFDGEPVELETYDFDSDDVEIDIPLKQFGGRIGRLDGPGDTEIKIGSDDGIAHRTGEPLVLNVKISKDEFHRYHVSPAIRVGFSVED